MSLEGIGPITWRDALTLVCGDLLGSGSCREVYGCKLDSQYVVKVERWGTRFQNPLEFSIWEVVKDDKALARWFAPVTHISDAGLWMIQRLTMPVTVAELQRELPRVPAFFTDLKALNWGRMDGRIVCHDFGLLMTTERGLSAKRMRKADWGDWR